MSPKSKIIGEGHGHVHNSENNKNHGFSGFRVFSKRDRKVTSPKRSRIFLWSFWATLIIIYSNAFPQTSPVSKFRIFLDFLGVSIGNQLSFGLVRFTLGYFYFEKGSGVSPFPRRP